MITTEFIPKVTLKMTTNVGRRFVGSFLRRHTKNILRIRKQTFATGQRPSIHLSKSDIQVDEKVWIMVSDLGKQQEVTVLSSLSENGKAFASCGHYVADDSGRVDLSLHGSLGGSFSGVQPMGLFTSAKEINGASRLQKLDVTNPYDHSLSIHDGHKNCESLALEVAQSKAKPLATTSLRRWYKATGVRKIPVEDGNLRGYLLLPPGEGPFPGIVDIFGLAGGVLDYRAALLASHGYAALSLAYISYKDLPTRPEDIRAEYFLEACDWLNSHPMVKPGGIGIVAHCIGGGIAMCAATRSPHVKTLVSTNGNPFAIQQMSFEINGTKVVGVEYDISRSTFTEEGIIQKDAFKHLDISKHLIPLWLKENMKVLILAGEEDQCVDVNWHRVLQEAIPRDKLNNFRFVFYSGAGHLLEPPYAPYCYSTYNKILGVTHLWGGKPESHIAAQEKAWKEILTFLENNLAS